MPFREGLDHSLKFPLAGASANQLASEAGALQLALSLAKTVA
jgi:hypothetical protein